MSPRGKLGIMQGRLSPKAPERLQSFPAGQWRREFFRARDMGCQCLEWLVDDYDLRLNPLFQSQGLSEALRLASETGVAVESHCAHVFIDGSLSGRRGAAALDQAGRVAKRTARAARAAGIERIVIPLMDEASLKTPGDWAVFREIVSTVDWGGLFLALELDMDMRDSIKLLEYLANDRIGLCYDLGNAVALGRDALAELPELLPSIREIHIKDRLVGGGSRCLGAGATPVADCLRMASEWGYQGTYILETPVEDDWERCAEHNVKFIEAIWSQNP